MARSRGQWQGSIGQHFVARRHLEGHLSLRQNLPWSGLTRRTNEENDGGREDRRALFGDWSGRQEVQAYSRSSSWRGKRALLGSRLCHGPKCKRDVCQELFGFTNFINLIIYNFSLLPQSPKYQLIHKTESQTSTTVSTQLIYARSTKLLNCQLWVNFKNPNLNFYSSIHVILNALPPPPPTRHV